jgi:hypothetical protein
LWLEGVHLARALSCFYFFLVLWCCLPLLVWLEVFSFPPINDECRCIWWLSVTESSRYFFKSSHTMSRLSALLVVLAIGSVQASNVTSSTTAVDVSQLVSSSTASCNNFFQTLFEPIKERSGYLFVFFVSSEIYPTGLKSAGVTRIIPRGFCSTGSVDSNVCSTLKNAQSAGIATRDA